MTVQESAGPREDVSDSAAHDAEATIRALAADIIGTMPSPDTPFMEVGATNSLNAIACT